MMVVVCLSIVFLHGMENKNTLNFLIAQTTIQLTKGNIYDVDGKVDFIVVGRVQQGMLRDGCYVDVRKVGKVNKGCISSVYIKNKKFDSASGDDTYKSCGFYTEHELSQCVYQQKLQSKILRVVEPRISKRTTDREEYYFYYRWREGLLKQCRGHEAVEEALKDLAVCYTNVLVKGCKELQEKELKNITLSVLGIDVGLPKEELKSIALPALGNDVGVPRPDAACIAVTTILEFIKNNPKGFSLIHLFVKKRSDFAQYKEFLEKYGGLK